MPLTDVAWYNVHDYTTPDIAVSTAMSNGGGVVYFPAGEYFRSTALELPPDGLSYSLTLRGDGANASRLRSAIANPFFDLLRIGRSHVRIEGLTFDARANASGSQRGIVVGESTEDVSDIAIRDCIIRNTASCSLDIVGGTTGSPIASKCLVERCIFVLNSRDALVRIGEGCFQHELRDCTWDFYVGSAMQLFGCRHVTVVDGDIESPNDHGTAPFVVARDATNCRFRNVWFEEPSEPGSLTSTQWFLDLGRGCNGWVIEGCRFQRHRFIDGYALKLIRVGDDAASGGGPSVGVLIVNPYAVIPAMPSGAAPALGSITLRTPVSGPATECTLIAGMIETESGALYSLDMLDPTSKSQWLSNRRWRLPSVNPSEDAPTTSLHLGDVLSRPGRGLEAWNANATAPGWIPLSVNRYPNQVPSLNGVPSSSINLGSLAWVDDEAALKVCIDRTAPTWKKIDVLP